MAIRKMDEKRPWCWTLKGIHRGGQRKRMRRLALRGAVLGLPGAGARGPSMAPAATGGKHLVPARGIRPNTRPFSLGQSSAAHGEFVYQGHPAEGSLCLRSMWLCVALLGMTPPHPRLCPLRLPSRLASPSRRGSRNTSAVGGNAEEARPQTCPAPS